MLEDLISDHNDFIVKENSNRLGFTPMEVFYLRQILDALPVETKVETLLSLMISSSFG